MYPGDFTRNDLDYRSPVLYGNGLVAGAVGLACQLPGRHVYAWLAPGRFVEQKCS